MAGRRTPARITVEAKGEPMATGFTEPETADEPSWVRPYTLTAGRNRLWLWDRTGIELRSKRSTPQRSRALAEKGWTGPDPDVCVHSPSGRRESPDRLSCARCDAVHVGRTGTGLFEVARPLGELADIRRTAVKLIRRRTLRAYETL